MKKLLPIVLFAIIAIGLIWAGMWYNEKSSEDASKLALEQGIAAQQAQSQIMEKLKMVDIRVGTGATAQSGQMVTVNYVGTLDDGTKFDSSYDHQKPFTFPLGAGQVIQGWDLGVLGMKVGGKRQLTIPPELGYGARTNGPIPANSTLHFTIELLAVTSTVSQ